MSIKISTEPVENSEYLKYTLSSYDHLPIKTKYNTIPAYRTSSFDPVEVCEPFLNFDVFEDDVWIVTFPKCGTTWTQEMVWLLMNNLDFEELDLKKGKPIDIPRPRLLKTHSAMQLLPKQLWTKNPKIIFVVRDPRDAFISMFHHIQFFFGKTFNENLESFVENGLKYEGFWEMALNFYALRDRENIMFFSYEQMKKDLKIIVLKVSAFLGKEYSEADINKLVNHLDFNNMKDLPAVSHRIELEEFKKEYNIKDEDVIKDAKFMRKGVVGSYKKEMSEELLQKIDSWEKSYLDPEHLTLDDILFFEK
uniref:Sulfotransferase domain-containing protein n=1 Tax=Megaselia scalaris TaxID=36166 RepID=T1GQK1_MEGSC